MNITLRLPAIIVAMASFFFISAAQPVSSIKQINGTGRLMVDGKPFLMVAGELHNSTSSTPYSLTKAMATTKAMGLNTVLVSVMWEQIEPTEDNFQFAIVDTLISLAERHSQRLVVLWFGSWKNGESSYMPLWAKSDTKRFFRARDAQGRNTTTVSPFCIQARNADVKAFAALMRHIAQRDTSGRIVAVQVENEPGVFLDIDHCPQATKAFAGSPERRSMGDSDSARQCFMTRQYASYINAIAKAGKREHPLPMFVNCWLPDGAKLGNYPNGGPIPELIDVYKQHAPDIDWLSPDIYANNFRHYCQAYTRSDNILFIPETWARPDLYWYAMAECNAQCVSAFAIEDYYSNAFFTGSLTVLHELLPYISEAQGTGRMRGFMRQGDEKGTSFTIGDITFRIEYIEGISHAFGLVIRTADNSILASGMGARIYLEAADPSLIARFDSVADVVRSPDGGWTTICNLNGDQTKHNACLQLRGRTENTDFGNIPAPLTDISFSRITWEQNRQRFTLPGIYTARIFTIPAK